MHPRRSVLRSAAVACTATLAGCADVLRGGPNPDVGRPELQGSLVGTGNETATVVVDVENTGPTGEIRVTANVVDDEGTIIDSHEKTAEIAGGETRTFEFSVTPREHAATVKVRAVAV